MTMGTCSSSELYLDLRKKTRFFYAYVLSYRNIYEKVISQEKECRQYDLRRTRYCEIFEHIKLLKPQNHRLYIRATLL